MKKVLLALMCMAAMMAAGTSLKAQEVTIVLMPGWTWISYLGTEPQDFSTALGSFTPVAGDIITSQWGSATYVGNGQWRGTISQFYPGYGYKYKSNRTVPVTLTLTPQQPAPQVVVTTSEPLMITAISAMCGGEVTVSDGTYIITKGLCWATHENPTTNDDFYEESESGVGSFSISMTDLNIGTTYYVRAYAVTPNGTVYGDQKTFTTRDGIPILTTAEVTNIGGGWAYSGGDITDNGGLNIIARGLCWSTSSNPTIADSHTTDDYSSGTGNFTGWIMGLSASTIYYVRAYATTTVGVGYGEQKTFTTLDNALYIDLGLPSGLLWAPCNVGANSPEEYGDYFAWGETQPKTTYGDCTYQYIICSEWEEDNLLTKYCNNSQYGYNGFTDNLTILQPEDDAATTNWGSGWRMPTKEEWQELLNNTTCTEITQSNMSGILFTATNGNSLFLPIAGIRDGSSLYHGDGYYWSSSLNIGYPHAAWCLSIVQDEVDYLISYGNRNRVIGLPVRPVRSTSQSTSPIGALNGLFSVNESKQVYFSQGNLQYQASTDTWRFAENQYDYIGNTNSNISSTYSDWIDLFGWGTSGYNHGAVCYQPWSISQTDSDYYAYGSSTFNLFDQTGQADWGYNPISNGGNTVNRWRTLTEQEWQYVFDNRATPSGIRYAKAKVNNVNGVILLPDDWISSTYSLSNTNNSSASYSSNTMNVSQWNILEQAGAVFLPAAGYRNGTSVSGVSSYGRYWSASYNDSGNAYHVYFNDSNLYTNYSKNRCRGRSVRLVCKQSFIIDATANPTEGGEVSGGGDYQEGTQCTLTATPAEGYTFVKWTEHGELVSNNPQYTFTVNSGRQLVATFVYNNGGNGVLNGVFSVNNNVQIRFSQGNLQYQASTNTWRFAENQYDYVGNANNNISSIYSGWIDLFGWGTGNTPTNSLTNDYYGTFIDWGNNPMLNGGNMINQWRTLTKQEWQYVFNTRTTPSGIRYAKANVNNVNGIILLPDDWSSSSYNLNSTNSIGASFSSNTITASQWSTLEQAGAVFIPAAGYRFGTWVSNVGSVGDYWSATSYSGYYAYLLSFGESSLNPTVAGPCYYGRSVRLVRSAE